MEEYSVKAIPTEYMGRIYRSRLEARWAAFFTLLEWPFEYEPFDLCGWTPDFLLNGSNAKVLVEVKPTDDFFEYKKYDKAVKHTGKYFQILLLNSIGPWKGLFECEHERLFIGKYQYTDNDFWDGENAMLIEGCQGLIDILSPLKYQSVFDNFDLVGSSWETIGDTIVTTFSVEFNNMLPEKKVNEVWAKAGNAVQFMKSVR